MLGINEYIQNIKEICQVVPEGILITNINGEIVFLNKALLTYCNTTNKDCINISADSFIPKYNFNSQLKVLRKDRACIKNLQLNKNGKTSQTIQALLFLLEHEGKELGQLFVFVLEKSEKHSNLNKNNPILQVLNTRQDELWFVSDFRNSRPLFYSQSHEKIFGWAIEESMIGGWVFSYFLVHPDDQLNVMKLLAEELTLRNTTKIIHDNIPIKIKLRLKNRSNNWIWLLESISVLERDENENIKYMIGSVEKIDSPELEEKIKLLQLLEKNFIIKDGKTFVNLEALLEIQKRNLAEMKSSNTQAFENFHLSNRELEILSLIVDGLSTDKISQKINISKNTVNMHRKQIMKKMQANNLADLVRKSMENMLFDKKA